MTAAMVVKRGAKPKESIDSMWDQLSFVIKRLHERLWIKPLGICVLSIIAVYLASLLDMTDLGRFLPEFSKESTEALLKIMASSMLVMATFSVGSMVSAYTSASSSATPRSFPLIIADDVSQNALSVFIGAFIYSVVAIVALMNGHFEGKASLFVLFVLTTTVFAIVILSFIWWVDSIARLGRLGYTIDKVEAAAKAAIQKRKSSPRLGGIAVFDPPKGSQPVYGDSIGYVQRINTVALQEQADQSQLKVLVTALPGTFCMPGRPVAWIVSDASESVSSEELNAVSAAFVIGDARVFDEDPRFGLIVLSEIASRALSPAVNDPGTAIDVTHTQLRLFLAWHECGEEQQDKDPEVQFDRVAVPELSMADMFDDAFAAIARDGAGTVEVIVRLLKVLQSLTATSNPSIRAAAVAQAEIVLARAEKALTLPQDLATAQKAAAFIAAPESAPSAVVA
ncbi:MAG: DUF2254 domain-containing protein [Planctomycetaceae bacterium]